jgi:hypothetical protein
MSIILNEQKIEIPTIKTLSWQDPEASAFGIKEVTDKSSRKTWIRAIVCHTTKGKLGQLLPGFGPKTDRAIKYAKYQTQTDRDVSWDFTCDFDGNWIVQNDPLKFYTWHAGAVNGYTCGFEIVQDETGNMYENQVAKAVEFIDFLTAKLGIQRQIPWDVKNNKPFKYTIERIAGSNHGKDVVGVYCHYHQTNNRGFGDPGPWLQIALKEAGYETYAFDGDDREVWKERQKTLGIEADGVPGIQGCSLLSWFSTAPFNDLCKGIRLIPFFGFSPFSKNFVS